MTAPRLRGYLVEGPLGRGGSGEVWQARVASTGVGVALKRIRVADAAQLERAEAEAALLRALEHGNLVRLHAAVPDGDAVVLVLDLAAGGSLAELLRLRGRLAPGEVVGALAPIAAAVAYLHERGVVHGDVSAGNVLFSAAGVPLLADVGVARLTGDTKDAEATPAYVDPQVAGGALPGPPSDVFMLGGVALHALTGAPPWDAASSEAALAQAASGELPEFRTLLAAHGVPEPIARVVCRALDGNPYRRGTAAEFALDLGHAGPAVAVELRAGRAGRAGPRHAAQPGRPQFARPPLPTSRPGGPPPTRGVAPRARPVLPRSTRRRRPSRAMLLGCGCVLAAAVAGGAAWSQAADKPTHDPVRHSAHGPAHPTAQRPDWAGTLAALDARRAQAFATRDPRLLETVYPPGALRNADTKLLTRIVPPGCALVGVHSRYAAVHVAGRSGSSVTVTTTATLPPSTLMCAGRARGTAGGTGPTRLRVRLVQTAAGWRIAGQAQVS
jgi:hypothetical protein